MKKYSPLAVCLFVIFLISPLRVFSATLSISPSSAKYSVGDRVTVSVVVSTDTPLNAISGVIKFPPNLFSIDSVSKADSILNFWVSDPSFSKTTGVIKFEGVSLTGFSSSGGNVLKINLKAVASGSAQVSFESVQILANDGKGTDITSKINGAIYTINVSDKKPTIEIKDEKDEEIKTPVTKIEEKKINPPVIALSKKDGLPAISGISTYKKSDVVLSFSSSEGSKVFITGLTDENGQFTFIAPTLLKNGPYSVVGYIVLDEGRQKSDESNVIVLSLKNRLDYLTKYIVTALVILIVILLTVLIYLVRRRRRSTLSGAETKRTIKEKKITFDKIFNTLKQNTAFYHKNDKTDAKKLKNIINDLDEAKSVVDEQMDDINSKI